MINMKSRQTNSRRGKTNETKVKPTKATVSVKPRARPGRKAEAPIPEPALDHRRQIVGTDELKGSRKRKSSSGGRRGNDEANPGTLPAYS